MSSVGHSLILPVHDQGDHIAALVDGYMQTLRDHLRSYEIILVANGCADDTVERCVELEARHEPVRHVALEDSGWGRAVRRGLREARGDVICYTNSARTSAEILTLILVYSRIYPDVVLKANRRVRESLRRRFGSLLYNLEARALFDLSVWDINGTPKVFPRKFSKLLELERDDDLIDLEFNVVCRREGYPVIEVPILATQRYGGQSTTGYKSAAKMYLGAYRLAKQLRR